MTTAAQQLATTYTAHCLDQKCLWTSAAGRGIKPGAAKPAVTDAARRHAEVTGHRAIVRAVTETQVYRTAPPSLQPSPMGRGKRPKATRQGVGR